MTTPDLPSRTFAELYCEQRGISAEKFEPVVFRRALYPHARCLHRLITFLAPDYFAADHDIVRATGRLRRVRDFAVEAAEFACHPANTGSLRRTFRVRLSTGRLRALLRQTLHPAHPEADDTRTTPPFAASEATGDRKRKKNGNHGIA
ncbi:hypothetical protein OpiT1DRAFT_01399 [Opitutaceae bacterium TAV1]|nr:hypothetical protein OpiT1DRAFT_01399 [Opitutaceae bacterium TAV1]